MKVVQVSNRWDSAGGAVTAARLVAKGVAEKGCEVVVITTHGEKGLELRYEGGLKVYSFLPRNLYWVGGKDTQPLWKKVCWQLVDTWNPDAYRVVRSILEKERPDIVHVHKLRGLSPSVWSAAQRAGVGSIIQTCQDYELISPQGALEGLVGRLASRRSILLRPYQSLRGRRSRAVGVATAPSRYTLRFLCARGLFASAEHRVVPNSHGVDNGVLVQRSSRPQQRSVEGPKQFLFLSRFEKIKGVEILLEAFQRAFDESSGHRLVMAGWGSLQAELEDRYREHPTIRVVGPVFGREKDELLEASDALVLPSIWPETFGIVIAEAYSFGKPVIVSEQGGMAELVDQERTGFVVPAGDVDALRRVLEECAKPRLLAAMGRACLDKAREYSPETVIDQYMEIYSESIDKRAAAP